MEPCLLFRLLLFTHFAALSLINLLKIVVKIVSTYIFYSYSASGGRGKRMVFYLTESFFIHLQIYSSLINSLKILAHFVKYKLTDVTQCIYF